MSDFYKREGVTVETVDPYHAASLEAQGFEKVDDPTGAEPENATAKPKRARPSRAKGAKPEAEPEGESPEDDDLIGETAPEADGDDEAL